LTNVTDRPAAKRRITYRKTANINVKKLVYTHVTVTDVRTSKTAKIKSYFTILLHI